MLCHQFEAPGNGYQGWANKTKAYTCNSFQSWGQQAQRLPETAVELKDSTLVPVKRYQFAN